MAAANSLEKTLEKAGYDVLVDDRDQRPGVKFKDADLIGIPLRVVISERGLKDGTIEVKWRTDAAAHNISAATSEEAILAELETTRKGLRDRLHRAENLPGRVEGPMTPPALPQLPRLPFVLLGLMTAFTFGGPIAIGLRPPRGRQPGLAARPPGRMVRLRRGLGDGLHPDDGLPLALPGQTRGDQTDEEARRPRGRVVTLALVGLALVVGSFALSALLCAITRVVAPRFGFVDKPGGRKDHRAPTPLGGGVAIWLTVVLMVGLGALALGPGRAFLPGAVARSMPMEPGSEVGQLALILGLATVIMGMGLADDRVGLGWKLRLGVQVGLAAILVASGIQLTLFRPFDLPIVSGAITVLWIVGLDQFVQLPRQHGRPGGRRWPDRGLAVRRRPGGGRGPVRAGGLAGAGGEPWAVPVHNRHPARLFMGDAGSNFLGFLLGTLDGGRHVHPAVEGYSPYGVLTPLLVMAVPLYDTTSVILIRLREGRSPFEADRRHFRIGWSTAA